MCGCNKARNHESTAIKRGPTPRSVPASVARRWGDESGSPQSFEAGPKAAETTAMEYPPGDRRVIIRRIVSVA